MHRFSMSLTTVLLKMLSDQIMGNLFNIWSKMLHVQQLCEIIFHKTSSKAVPKSLGKYMFHLGQELEMHFM